MSIPRGWLKAPPCHARQKPFLAIFFPHPPWESAGILERSGRRTLQTPDMMFGVPVLSFFLIPFFIHHFCWFFSKKCHFCLFLAGQDYANRVRHAGYASSLRQPGDEARLWRDRDDAHARAGDSLPIGCGGGRKRKRCRLSEEGAQRGFGVPACHGEVWGARGGFAEHTACCKPGREHKSGRRVGSGGDR